jgi:hypothetical protein
MLDIYTVEPKRFGSLSKYGRLFVRPRVETTATVEPLLYIPSILDGRGCSGKARRLPDLRLEHHMSIPMMPTLYIRNNFTRSSTPNPTPKRPPEMCTTADRSIYVYCYAHRTFSLLKFQRFYVLDYGLSY